MTTTINGHRVPWGNIATAAGILIPVMTATIIIYQELVSQISTSLAVARDHGAELHLVREELAELRGAILTGIDDRFRKADWLREREWIEEIVERHERVHDTLEERLQRCDCR